MTSIKFVFRASARGGHNEGALYLRLIRNRKSRMIVLPGCRVYPGEWNESNQVMDFPKDNPERKKYLEELENNLYEEREKLRMILPPLEKQGRYSVDDIIRLFRERRDDGSLRSYAEQLAAEKERRGQIRTARAYHTVVQGLIKFNKGEDIRLEHLNSCLIQDFEAYLRQVGKLPNTISYYMRNLRAIFNKAVSDKHILNRRNENPFAQVYTGVTKTMKRALSFEEIKQLCNLDFESMREGLDPASREYTCLAGLQTAHRYFTFCLYSRGMCFVDMVYLKKSNIQGETLRYVRKKTGKQIEMKVTREMKAIIESFAGDVKKSPYLFPILQENDGNLRRQYESALRTQNHRLKRLAVRVGINKMISTHWARHSWATMAKKESIPLRVISECLGHSSEKTTLIYLDSLDNSLLDAANDLIMSSLSEV